MSTADCSQLHPSWEQPYARLCVLGSGDTANDWVMWECTGLVLWPRFGTTLKGNASSGVLPLPDPSPSVVTTSQPCLPHFPAGAPQ